MEETITITPSELKALITEAIAEGKIKDKTNGVTIFNKSNHITKRKHELHMLHKPLRDLVEKEISIYHPIPDKFLFASINHFNKNPSLSQVGRGNMVHELTRKFALMCFGVSTNRGLLSTDEEKAVTIYNQLIELFFKNYEEHLDDKFSESSKASYL